MRAGATWRPVLDGADAVRAAELIEGIGAAIAPDRLGGADLDASLATGLAGLALFSAQRHRTTPQAGHARAVTQRLEAATAMGNSVAYSPAFFSGITGFAWVVEHLRSFAAEGLVESVDGVESALVAALDDAPRATEFDLTSGLVGLGILLLERSGSSTARHGLSRLVDWLEAGAEDSPDGLSWRAGPGLLEERARAEFPEGCHYTGVAHGTAGVIGFLAALLRAEVEPVRARRLLGGAVEWLLAQQQEGPGALFPFQTLGRGERPPSRSGWCTGGPGISFMLWRAGLACDERRWKERAIGLAREAMERPLDRTGVLDACLCHGSAGLGHLYAHWFNATGEEAFRAEARRWFRRTFDEHRAGEGVAGFTAMNLPLDRREASTGLLFGAAGIGLTLLAATTSVPPHWDRAFLLTEPPPHSP